MARTQGNQCVILRLLGEGAYKDKWALKRGKFKSQGMACDFTRSLGAQVTATLTYRFESKGKVKATRSAFWTVGSFWCMEDVPSAKKRAMAFCKLQKVANKVIDLTKVRAENLNFKTNKVTNKVISFPMSV